jgi:4-hydroxythreonine-4-phosphate dehydrogenase
MTKDSPGAAKSTMQDRPKTSTPPVVALTMGDPAGIGPEICLRAAHHPSVRAACMPIIFGDWDILRLVAERCKLPKPSCVASKTDWDHGCCDGMPDVVDCAALDGKSVQPGKVQKACARAAYEYIRTSIQAALEARIAAVATAPIHKEALKLAKIPYPGHTEIFAALTKARRACMMLASDEITVSFVTTHIGYAEVTSKLTTARIIDVIELTAEAVSRLRTVQPRIVVCGLNPHAGENRLFGCGEEEESIKPAVARARAKGLRVEGPISPDAAFLPERRRDVDAYVCMYHDQGHIPFKMLAFDRGVNVTLGLPIVRTSVDHGTAFDIAWSGRASARSMIEAVLWAARLATLRKPGRMKTR